FYAKAIDQETKDLIYSFEFPEGTITTEEKTIDWTTPAETGPLTIRLIIEDEGGLKDTAILEIEIVDEINLAPSIQNISAPALYTIPGGSIPIQALVTDANSDPIEYFWSVDNGSVTGSGPNVEWQPPAQEGIATLQLRVEDGRG